MTASCVVASLHSLHPYHNIAYNSHPVPLFDGIMPVCSAFMVSVRHVCLGYDNMPHLFDFLLLGEILFQNLLSSRSGKSDSYALREHLIRFFDLSV